MSLCFLRRIICGTVIRSCKELGIKADIKHLLYQNRHIQMEYPAASGRIVVGDIQ